MYERNGKQRNKTNAILVFFFSIKILLETTIKTISKSTFWKLKMCNLRSICTEWGTGKIRISEELRAENLQKASSNFKHEIYTITSDLDTPTKMFAVDIYCHKNCYATYIGKWNRATSIPNTSARTTSKTKRDIFKKGIFSIRHQGHDQSRWQCQSEKQWNQRLPNREIWWFHFILWPREKEPVIICFLFINWSARRNKFSTKHWCSKNRCNWDKKIITWY